MKLQNRHPKPKWWQLYLTFPVLAGLFVLDTHLQLSTGGHEAVQLGSLFLEFGLVQLWLHSNSSALNYMDEDEFSQTIRVIEIPPAAPSELAEGARPRLALPPSEIPSVLGDTFEMDYIDAKSFNVDAGTDSASKESK